MLTEERYARILKLLEDKGSVTVQELKEFLDTSESTIRRDLNALGAEGKLIKVFGGAVAAEGAYNTQDADVAQREKINIEEKRAIAAYAASLIRPDDFVFLDAGTTTGLLPDYLTEKSAAFVTNAPGHASKLAALGVRVYLVGGELKPSTEALVGNEAVENLQKYHFTIGFFGANGVTQREGFTTPDLSEALVKRRAMENTRNCFVLCDHEKLSQVSSVTFGTFSSASVITDRIVQENYKSCDNVIEVPSGGRAEGEIK